MNNFTCNAGKAAVSIGKEKSSPPSGSPELPHPVSMNSSSSTSWMHTFQPHPPRLSLVRTSTTATGKQSTTKKRKQSCTKKVAKKCYCSPTDPHRRLLREWYKASHSQQSGYSQHLSGGSQTAGGQTAGHPLPLRPIHYSSSSSCVSSGGSEVASASLSQPGECILA